jgi:Uma2 family endonuclease
MASIAPERTDMTADELAARVGPVPLSRIRNEPWPGDATEADVERIRRTESVLCELLDGVLVEKAVSDMSAFLAMALGRLLGNFVAPRQLGWTIGPDGFVWLLGKKLRSPDVSFVRRDQRPGGRLLVRGYAEIAPALAVEIFSPGNTAGEMKQKRRDFFAAGTELFWIVYPERREIEVFTAPEAPCAVLGLADTLDGGAVLPEFTLPVAELFAAVDLGPLGDDRAGK